MNCAINYLKTDHRLPQDFPSIGTGELIEQCEGIIQNFTAIFAKELRFEERGLCFSPNLNDKEFKETFFLYWISSHTRDTFSWPNEDVEKIRKNYAKSMLSILNVCSTEPAKEIYAQSLDLPFYYDENRDEAIDCLKKFAVVKNLVKFYQIEMNPKRLSTSGIGCDAVMEGLEKNIYFEEFDPKSYDTEICKRYTNFKPTYVDNCLKQLVISKINISDHRREAERQHFYTLLGLYFKFLVLCKSSQRSIGG